MISTCEFGDIEVLRAKHEGEPLADVCPAVPNDQICNKSFVMRVKDCMADPDFDEVII